MSSNVYINSPKNDEKIATLSSDKVMDVEIEKKQFMSGYIDIKVKNKVIGNVELKGIAEEDRLRISTILSEEIVVNLLRAAK